jgi:hypothetical protein
LDYVDPEVVEVFDLDLAHNCMQDVEEVVVEAVVDSRLVSAPVL